MTRRDYLEQTLHTRIKPRIGPRMCIAIEVASVALYIALIAVGAILGARAF